jgi:hypothetical protein
MPAPNLVSADACGGLPRTSVTSSNFLGIQTSMATYRIGLCSQSTFVGIFIFFGWGTRLLNGRLLNAQSVDTVVGFLMEFLRPSTAV